MTRLNYFNAYKRWLFDALQSPSAAELSKFFTIWQFLARKKHPEIFNFKLSTPKTSELFSKFFKQILPAVKACKFNPAGYYQLVIESK